MRENDLRDCLDELAKRWSEAFQRKGVKLETSFDPSIPTFRFDYQKVQQAAANLLDNSLKHTPAGGTRDVARRDRIFGSGASPAVAPVQERAEISVAAAKQREKSALRIPDRGSRPSITRRFLKISCEWIATLPEWAWGWRLPSGLIQAHRGKIWVESEAATWQHVYVSAADGSN